MNQVILIGRLVKDPEIRYIPGSQTAVANFSIAVDRPFSKEKKTDFFNIVVFGKPAENCGSYLVKGRLAGIQGRIQNESYEKKDGTKGYKTDIVAERVEFLERGDKKTDNQSDNSASNIPTGFELMLDDDDSDIPF
jgi:single-strand DNA-binding protein